MLLQLVNRLLYSL